MFSQVAVFLVLGLVLSGRAYPQGDPQAAEGPAVTPIAILSQAEELEPNGTYKFSYETGNGIKVEESIFNKVIPFQRTAENADLKDAPETVEVHVQQGSYSYVAPDGNTISLRYIADENGFQPIGDHLPTSPPIPDSILKSLEQGNPDAEAIPAPVSGDVRIGAASAPVPVAVEA